MVAGAFIVGALLASYVRATAIAHKRQAITALTAAQITAFKPFSSYAAAAYCSPSTTINWSCGANCNANPDFQPVASGGDGSDTQFWYVGFDPAQNTVIVGHQGTDTSSIVADLTDADIAMEPLDSTLFPGVSSSVEAHAGFAGSQARSASDVLSAVKTTLANHPTNSVTVVGHSLGAAIALIDSVFLTLNLPTAITVTMIGYGMPRVGNQAWADYIDAHQTVTHINNKEDIVPILPGMFLGFHHPSGEVHIQDSGVWDACPGQDNDSNMCTTGDVPNIFEGDTGDHDGPYDGIEMGSSTC